ncbi:MAG: quinol oxidase [Geobacter sp.]|nr:MAG: quinol oxidase [Geobacter sp.]
MKGLAMILVAGVLLYGYSPVVAEETPQPEKMFRATIGTDGIQHVDILGGGYFFRPNHIVVRVNVPVELRVRKEATYVPHDITMKAPEAGIDFSVSLGEEPKVVKFTPTRTGTYPFYCAKKLLFFESHREKGMEGVLDVVE